MLPDRLKHEISIIKKNKGSDFQVKIFDTKGNEIYGEFSNGFWHYSKFDSSNKRISRETSNGHIFYFK